MGQVLVKFDPEYFLDRVGVIDEEDRKILLRTVYKSVEWSRLDRGSLTEEEACEIMCSKLPTRLHEKVRQLTTEWARPIMEIDGMYDIVKELKENGYKIYLLSNASLNQKDYWNEIPCSKFFDGRVVSAEELLVKPQPEIYRLILERYNLVAEESVFIDDSTLNCEGAFLVGINPIVFHGDSDEVREKLIEYGVKIKR